MPWDTTGRKSRERQGASSAKGTQREAVSIQLTEGKERGEKIEGMPRSERLARDQSIVGDVGRRIACAGEDGRRGREDSG